MAVAGRRVQDPKKDFDVDEALRRLVAALGAADSSFGAELSPLAGASDHLRRCGAVFRTTEFVGDERFPVVPTAAGDEERPCCGKAQAILVLLGVTSNRSELTDLYEAVVGASGPFKALAKLLVGPAETLLKAIDDQAEDQSRSSVRAPLASGTPSPPRAGAAGLPASWFEAALAPFAHGWSAGDPPATVLRARVAALRASVGLLGVILGRMEGRLDDPGHVSGFPAPVAPAALVSGFPAPVAGAGRPPLDLLRAVARLLKNTGHQPREITRLIPTGAGEAAKRIRELLKEPRLRSRKKAPATQTGSRKKAPSGKEEGAPT